jgi:preprotein translocase subunit YajC
LLIVVVFYMFIIRPTRNRQRQALQLQSSVRPGMRVLTTGGLFATVVGADDEAVELELAPGVTTRWARGAIARILDDVEQVDGLSEGRDSLRDEDLRDSNHGTNS